MSGSEFFAAVWICLGIIFFLITKKLDRDSDLPFMICLLLGPFLLVFMLVMLPSIYLKDREEKRLKAIEEEYELEQLEARRLEQVARDQEQRAKKAAREENSRDFVRTHLRLASQRIAGGETSRDLIEVISDIAKHAKVIRKAELSSDFQELIPVLRHGRIYVYEALGDLPEAQVKKAADQITATLKRLS